MDSIHDDVAEFALLLTRLKERTDRSYAALARRLDLHASTLHRYCSGETVPQDFAGIERFAVLCGASTEERMELHRRWIMAVAARQRPRPSDARRVLTPRDTRDTEAPAANRSGPASEVPEVPEVPEPSEAAPSADLRFEPASPNDPRPHPGRRRRPSARSTVLAVSLAIVLAGLTTSAAGPFAARGESSADARVTPAPSTPAPHDGGTPRKHRADGPTASPSDSSGVTPEESAPATPSGGDPRNGRAGAGTAPPVAPLTWTTDSHTRGLFGCGESYVVAKPPEQVPPPPNPEDIAAWAASQRGVHAGTTDVRITVQGRGSAAVVLEALHVRVVTRATPAAGRGNLYSLSDGCGASIVPRYFSVDLDAYQPLARSRPGDNGEAPPTPALDFPYRVSLQDPEVLVVDAGTESCTCDWYLDLDWSSQGRTGTVRIDDHGSPFRTTSANGVSGYRYDRIYHHPGRWVPFPAADTAGSGD
ncbi:helix-turn-helix domain-containing protein [Streptomyces sp. NPDC059618]|uniref:transcriptional regulator n=1 Tax=Streptomyces sp. NPDC059618 TaxID=3346887 RepID=UPI0036922C5D